MNLFIIVLYCCVHYLWCDVALKSRKQNICTKDQPPTPQMHDKSQLLFLCQYADGIVTAALAVAQTGSNQYHSQIHKGG